MAIDGNAALVPLCSPRIHNILEEDLNTRARIKAKTLLLSRGISSLLDSLDLPPRQNEQYWRGLLTLQAAIFELDYFGEENWIIDRQVLAMHWRHIEAATKALDDSLVPDLEVIKAYQRIELALRTGNPVARVPIHLFYRLKSCDVWLMQRFLSNIANVEGRHMSDSSNVLNIIQEITDDLDDILEDTFTYNGNRIISMCVNYGRENTLREYRDFLLGLIRHARQGFAETRSNDTKNSQTWIEAIETATALTTEMTNQETRERLSFAESKLAVGPSAFVSVCHDAILIDAHEAHP